MNMKKFAALAAFAAFTSFVTNVSADGVVDGQKGALYGAPIAVQTVQTGFGDSGNPGGGSELNAAYAYCAEGRLYLLFTGNLEQNFNKMNIFFDTIEGGENVLSSIPDYDFFNGNNWISSNYGGHTFDDGFTADFHMYARSGGGDNYEVDFIDRLGGTSTIINGNSGAAVGFGTISPGSLANNAGASAIANDIFFFFDNTNTAGVMGGTGAADQAAAEAVTTGFEISIDLADLGLDSSMDNQIQVAAIIGNGDHNYHSNQTLGGLAAGTGNLGGDGAGGFIGDLSGINFNNFAGAQFMVIELPAHPVCASGGTLVEGAGELGDFNATCGSDDSYWAAHGETLFFQISDPVVQFELTALAPVGFAGSTISVDIEASKQSNLGNLNLRASLFNFTTGSYVSLPGVMALTTVDAVRNFQLPNGADPADFIEPGTDEVRLLLQTIQTSGIPTVRTQLDEVLFNF